MLIGPQFDSNGVNSTFAVENLIKLLIQHSKESTLIALNRICFAAAYRGGYDFTE